MQTSIRFYQFVYFDDAWKGLIEPWIQEHLGSLGNNMKAIVVPSLSVAIALKERLITEKISLLGVHFLTPASLREYVLKSFKSLSKVIVTPMDYTLLIQSIAERYSSNPVAMAIARDPEIFRRFYHLLISGGWGSDVIESDPLKKFTLTFERELVRLGFQTTQQVDHILLKKETQIVPIFDDLLLYGFSAHYWPLYSLLNLAIKMSSRADICWPQAQSCRADEVWIGTWEEQFGAARWLSGPSSINSFQSGVVSNRCSGVPSTRIRVAKTPQDEVEVVVRQILHFLSQRDCRRLGIVFVGNLALAREVSARLTNGNIPHYATLGCSPIRDPKQKLVEDWIRFQEDASFDTFLNWIRTLSKNINVGTPSVERILDVISTAFTQTRTEDFAVLKAAMSSNADMGDLLDSIGALLPESATLEVFRVHVTAMLRYCGWDEGIHRLEKQTRSLEATLKLSISRRCFLRWLRHIFNVSDRRPSELGCHPFSRVHLVTLQDALIQDWSHIILAGLNTEGDGQLEPCDSSLMPDVEIGRLNRRALRPGIQGEGHFVATPGYILSSAERQAQIQAELETLFTLGKSEIALTASLTQLKEGSGPSFGSGDLLAYTYWMQEGTLLSQERLEALYKSTEDWLEKTKPLKPNVASDNVGAQQTLRAWEVRRCEDRPFGEFDYAFREPPSEGIQFSCKVWEQALRQPASVWLEHVLGVRKQRSAAEREESSLALGIWVHDWLCISEEASCVKPDEALWLRSINERAFKMREQVVRSYETAGRLLPDWWDVEWNRARRYAQNYARVLAAQNDWPFAKSEYALPSNTHYRFGDEVDVSLRGRIDLILTPERFPDFRAGEVRPAKEPLWIIDLKTGSDRPLKPASMAQGKGLQLALYAMAFRSLGYDNILVSILGPDASHLEPQVDIDGILELTDLWEGFARVSYSGVLGCRPPQVGHPSVWDTPLATLAIDPTILSKKWLLTHPKLPPLFK